MKLRVPAPARRVLTPIANRARKLGLPVYVVGGAVRDWMLGETSYDLDLVVEGDPEPLARDAAARLRLPLSAFDRFGTARLGGRGKMRLDFATARRETYPEPAALPVVERPAPIVEDLRRRDFTVNAIALRLSPGPEELVDPYGGLADLEKGIVRVLHARSFEDDPTRVYRAARYIARLGFKPAPGLVADAARALEQGWAGRLSRHRLTQELLRIFGERHPAGALKLLRTWGYLALISPILGAVDRWPAWDGLDAEERLGALALALNPEAARELLGSLPVERSRLSWLEPALAALAESRPPKAALSPRARKALAAARVVLPAPALKPRFLRGADLEALGMTPGPKYREVLDEASALQWRGRLKTRRAALAWLAKRVPASA